MILNKPYPATERLIFRPYDLSDAAMLTHWFNDPRINRHFDHDPAFTEPALSAAIEKINAASDGMGLIAMHRQNNAPIGVFEIRNISRENASCSLEIAIGDARYLTQGYGAEMLRAMSGYAQNDLCLSRQELRVYSLNAPMLTIARREGFTVEGVCRAAKRFEGGWVDEIVLAKCTEQTRALSSYLRPAQVARHAVELIGNTPLIDLRSFLETDKEVFAKIEAFNPGTSIKDRAARTIIREAYQKGLLSKDGFIIEATSGNTSTGLALAASSMGIRSVAVAPEGVLKDGKKRHLKALGAILVITPGVGDYDRAVTIARNIRDSIPGSFMGEQFTNYDNPKAHHESTAREIICQLGHIECFVAALGSGGTLMGNAKELRRHFGKLVCIAVEPRNCSVLAGTGAGDHRILGIGPGFMPDIVDSKEIDYVETVTDRDAAEEALKFCHHTGLYVGISSGAVLSGFRSALQKGLFKKSAVAMLADSGLRYGGENCYYTEVLDERHKAKGGEIAVRPDDSMKSISDMVKKALQR